MLPVRAQKSERFRSEYGPISERLDEGRSPEKPKAPRLAQRPNWPAPGRFLTISVVLWISYIHGEGMGLISACSWQCFSVRSALPGLPFALRTLDKTGEPRGQRLRETPFVALSRTCAARVPEGKRSPAHFKSTGGTIKYVTQT